jgi:hypothetical protein
VKTSTFIDSIITASYTSSPSLVAGQEDARLENK